MAEIQIDKTRKSEIETPAHELGFAKAVLEKTNDFATHLDHQTNILIGVSSAIFLFAATEFEKLPNNFSFLSLAIFAAISALIALYAVHPPRFICKKGQIESLMYHKRISEVPSSIEYANDLKTNAHTIEEILNQYATEIYNVSKYYYGPKRTLFHASRNTLFLGLAISLIIFLASNWPLF